MTNFDNLEIIDLPRLKNIQESSYPLIEPLQPGETIQNLCDIDFSLLDNKPEETFEKVTRKVAILNEESVKLAMKTGKQVLVTLITRKPGEALDDKDPASIYPLLMKIESVRHGQTVDGQPCLVTLPLSHAYTEFGATTHTEPDDFEPKFEENQKFNSVFNLLQDFNQILAEYIIVKDGEKIYQLEPGNKVYTAVQMLGGEPMPLAIKLQVVKDIKAVLEKLGREDILSAFDFFVDENDVDCTPKILHMTKAIGIQVDIDSKHKQGYGWFNESNLVIIDDNFDAAHEAATRVLNGGGKMIIPANGDKALKRWVKGYPNVFISKHKTFLGVIDGLYWLATGRPMPDEKIQQIKKRLEAA